MAYYVYTIGIDDANLLSFNHKQYELFVWVAKQHLKNLNNTHFSS